MIQLDFPRLGILVRQYLTSRLLTDQYQIIYRKLINEYEEKHTKNGSISITPGRVKVDGTFPKIGIEAEGRSQNYAAIDYTTDVEFRYQVTHAIKNLASPKDENPYEGRIEDYIMTLSEFTFTMLNEPGSLQFNITLDENREPFPDGHIIRVYDSRAENLIYTDLYSGALRASRFTWWAKAMYCGGQTGILRNYNVP